MEAGYQRLQIYKLAHSLAVRIHKMSLTLPKFEMYEEGSQIRRSSKSASAQIVEGFALRKYKAEYLHYLYRAYGSCEETAEHLTFLYETGSLNQTDVFNDLTAESHDKPLYLKEPTAEYLQSGSYQNPESPIQNR